MGREEQAKAERAELRRAVVDEALGRVGELEEKIASHKKTINQQGRALEAIANALTAYAATQKQMSEQVALWIERPRGWRRVVAYFRETWQAIEQQDGPVAARKARSAGGVVVRRIEEDSINAIAERVRQRTMSEAGSLAQQAPAGPDHLHQYEKSGPFLYRCTVPGCERRATLQEIESEAEYLRGLDAGVKGH